MNHGSSVQQVAIPAGYRTPDFPSLYTPNFDITSRQLGVFLYDAGGTFWVSFPHIHLPRTSISCVHADRVAIWRFTLYWTLILVCGIYTTCAIIATANLFLSSTVFRPMPVDKLAPLLQPPTPLTSLTSPTPVSRSGHAQTQASSVSDVPVPAQPGSLPNPKPPDGPPRLRGQRRTRPPLWPLLLIPLISLAVAAVIAVISATVIGFALAALYSAGGFSMSTWVPFSFTCCCGLKSTESES